MTSEEWIELCLKRLSMGKTSDVMNFSYSDTLAYIERLKEENAELRKKLEKAEAKKSKLNPYIEQNNDGDYLVYRAEYILQYIIDSICRTHEAALARLAELKGGMR